jgi:ribosome-associated toxin RatA of RatAB toxin-antitoxin module
MAECTQNLARTSVTVSRPIGGDDPENLLQKAYAIITDVARYPDYMPSVEALDILSQNENRLVTRWDAYIDDAPVQWMQAITCLEDQKEMRFEATEGDFDVFRGKWSVSRSGDQVNLHLNMEYRLGIPVIEAVLGPILKEKLDANARALLQAIADRLEVQA